MAARRKSNVIRQRSCFSVQQTIRRMRWRVVGGRRCRSTQPRSPGRSKLSTANRRRLADSPGMTEQGKRVEAVRSIISIGADRRLGADLTRGYQRAFSVEAFARGQLDLGKLG